jgi:hypothetical protein
MHAECRGGTSKSTTLSNVPHHDCPHHHLSYADRHPQHPATPATMSFLARVPHRIYAAPSAAGSSGWCNLASSSRPAPTQSSQPIIPSTVLSNSANTSSSPILLRSRGLIGGPIAGGTVAPAAPDTDGFEIGVTKDGDDADAGAITDPDVGF